MNFAARPNKHTATRTNWVFHWVRPQTLGNLALMEGRSHRDAAMLAATQGNSDPRLWGADFVEVKFHGRRQRATLIAWKETAEGPFITTKVGRARRTDAGWVSL